MSAPLASSLQNIAGEKPLMLGEYGIDTFREYDILLMRASIDRVQGLNNLREYGRWGFTEITDPWDAADLIAETVRDVSRSNAAVTEG